MDTSMSLVRTSWSAGVQGSKHPASSIPVHEALQGGYLPTSDGSGRCGIGEGWCLPHREGVRLVRKTLCVSQIRPAQETEPTLGHCPMARVASGVLISRAGLEMCPPTNPRDTVSRTPPCGRDQQCC